MREDAIELYACSSDEINERFRAIPRKLAAIRRAADDHHEMKRLVIDLQTILRSHFPYERRLMTGCLYPDRESQETVHSMLENQLDHLKRLPANAPWFVESALRLVERVEAHLKTMDEELLRFLDAVEDEIEWPPETPADEGTGG